MSTIQLNRISAHATYHRFRVQHAHDEQYIIRDYYYCYFFVHSVFTAIVWILLFY